MKEILFTHSYFMRMDPKQWKTMQPYPPLATIYAAALLRENGIFTRCPSRPVTTRCTHNTTPKSPVDGLLVHAKEVSIAYAAARRSW